MSSIAMMTQQLQTLAEGKSMARPNANVLVAYGVFAVLAFYVYHAVADQNISSILTLGVMLQCLSFVLLGLKIHSTRSAAGISARTLGLEALSLVFRLSSTLWLNGYLPVDASGDWMYQAADLASLAVIAYLLWQVLVDRASSYQASLDTFDVRVLLVVTTVLACLFHASMNHRPLFDITWTIGLYVDIVAMLPQLWLIMQNAGSVESLTSHYIATTAMSRMLSGLFWYLTKNDVVSDSKWIEDFNHGSWGIVLAHAFHFLLMTDFIYYYGRACLRGTLGSGMPLACGEV